MTKTFRQWAEEKGVTDALEIPAFDENTKRAGIAFWQYPSAYIKSQYPDLYFTPHAADAPFKMSKKPKDKAAPENTPG